MLINADGEKEGIVDINSALDSAKAASLDLVQVSSSDADPVVCKLLDYGKHIFDNYLDTKSSVINNIPKIPMKINGLYPNPSFGKLQINIDNYPGGEAKVNIFNILGQNIFSRKINNIPSGKQNLNLDLNHVDGLSTSAGMYFIKIQTQKEQAVKKCIILKN